MTSVLSGSLRHPFGKMQSMVPLFHSRLTWRYLGMCLAANAMPATQQQQSGAATEQQSSSCDRQPREDAISPASALRTCDKCRMTVSNPSACGGWWIRGWRRQHLSSRWCIGQSKTCAMNEYWTGYEMLSPLGLSMKVRLPTARLCKLMWRKNFHFVTLLVL